MPARRYHLDHQQTVRHPIGFGQDIGDMAHIGALAAHLLAHRVGPDHVHRAVRKGRGRTDGQFDLGFRRHRPVRMPRHIDSRRLAVEWALAFAHFAQRLASCRHAPRAGHENQADLPIPRRRRNALPGGQLMQRKPHIPPPGTFRRHIDHLAGIPRRFDEQFRHQFASSFSGANPAPILSAPPPSSRP